MIQQILVKKCAKRVSELANVHVCQIMDIFMRSKPTN